MTPWVRWLLTANIVVFFFQLAMPSLYEWLAFAPQYVLFRPWTILTYMFAHDDSGFSHIFWNMIGLVFFGARVEDRLGSSHFIRFYLASGVGGALLSFLTPNVSIVGASGAVFGVMLAYARFWPRDRIMIWGVLPIEARWLVVILTALALNGARTGTGTTAHFAHLGGFVGAWIYLTLAERFSAAKRWQRKVSAPPKGLEKIDDWSKIDLTGIHAVNREEVERLIAKIREDGERSLSGSERVFLAHFIPKQG